MSESALWTVLPDGIDPDTGMLRATIFVSPRLGTDGAGSIRLADCEAFANWPTTLRDLEFTVEVDGIGKRPAKLDARVAEPDPSTWKLVFGGDVGVTDAGFRDLSERRVRTFPADEIARDIVGLYADVALDHSGDFPPVTTGPLAEWAEQVGRIGDHREHLYRRLDELFNGERSEVAEGRKGRYVPAGRIPQAQRRFYNFLQAYRFYDRFTGGESVRSRPGPIDPDAVPPPPAPPEIDFHGYVAALGDYPYLLRLLGLAIDVRFDHDPAFTGDHRLRLLIDGGVRPWMAEEVNRPWLNYELGDRLFLARSRHKFRLFTDGQLNLRSDFFAVHQIDIDGSAMKAINVSASALRLLQHLGQTQPSVTPDELSLPALRSTGFTLVHRNRAADVVEQFDHAVLHDQDVQTTQPANLFAEDVTRGYRLDVAADGSGDFRSLMHRSGDYAVATPQGAQPIDVPPDEGYAKAASTTAVPGDEEELYLHEAVLSWGGWSLVAKRPGLTVSPAEEIEASPVKPDPGVPLVTSFKPAKGTLTRLRYGTPYAFRVRLVDLAGNSVPTELIADEHATEPEPFFRWEPVPSPAVLPRRRFGEGESQLRLVIRSTLAVGTEDYVALPRVANLAGHTTPDTAYLAFDDRWLAAPKTAQQLAEFHGVFDEAIGAGLAQAAVDAGFDVAARESGALAEVEPAEQLALPYLPDVSGRGVALTSLPNDPASNPTRQIPWPADDAVDRPWWDRQPFRIRIVSGPGPAPVTPVGTPLPPEWDEANRLLTVFLPQAEQVDVRLSSAIAPGDLSIQGLYNQVFGALTPQQRKDAEGSRAWLFTPWQTLTLVHAVEKPLLAPVVDVPPSGLQRLAGETFCALVGSIDNHAKSTGRLDVDATWTEQHDDLSEDAPADGVDGRPLREAHGHVGDFNLLPTEDDCRVGRDDRPPLSVRPPQHLLRHEFGDTRHRLVNYHATATTRFREYFPAEVYEGTDPDTGERLVTNVGPVVARHVPSSRRPEPPEVEYVLPTFSWTEEFRRPTPAGPGGLALGRFATTIRKRLGGGLRVYLKRGWYSSGDGELLGVVLADQPWLSWPLDVGLGLAVSEEVKLVADRAASRLFDRGVLQPRGRAGLAATERLVRAAGISGSDLAAAAADPAAQPVLRTRLAAGLAGIEAELSPILAELLAGGIDPDKLVSHWGSDPVWGSALPAGGPFIHQFPLRSAVATGLSLQETSRAKVAVVGHTPRFDPARRLWYCDIQLNAGAAYTPFVRLALARYQPHSIPDAHLSRVVLADFAQLVPDRTATFTVRPGSARVSVAGPAGYNQVAASLTGNPQSPFGLGVSRRLSVQVQRLAAAADPDLGWAAAGAETDLQVAAGTVALGSVRWSGQVALPEAPAGTRQRLLVREYERLETDPDADDPLAATLVVHSGPAEFPTIRHLRERLVYADTLDLGQ